jgi:hypothetical protein
MKEKVRGKLFYLFIVTMWHINCGRQGFPYCREKSCYGAYGKAVSSYIFFLVKEKKTQRKFGTIFFSRW